MKQTKAAGSVRERQVVQYFRQRGFVAFRTPASLGVCDVVALKEHLGCTHGAKAIAYFCEVKANHGSPFMNFRGPERRALIEAAQQAGATPLLAFWPPNGELRLIGADEWPEAKHEAKAA